MTWLFGVRIVIGGLALARLARDVASAREGRVPVTRCFLPLLALVAVALTAGNLIPRPVAAAGLALADVLFLSFCFALAAALRAGVSERRLPEERLQDVLERFFPPFFARYTSIELTVLRHAFAGVKAFVSPPKPTYASYVNGSPLGLFAMMLVLGAVPDAFLRWVFLPNLAWPIALGLNALELWACLWLFGLYGTMAARPHEISAGGVVLRNGVLGCVRFQPCDIVAARVLESTKRRHLPRKRGDGSHALVLGGVPIVHVTLAGGKDVFVASDAPHALCEALAAAPA